MLHFTSEKKLRVVDNEQIWEGPDLLGKKCRKSSEQYAEERTSRSKFLELWNL